MGRSKLAPSVAGAGTTSARARNAKRKTGKITKKIWKKVCRLDDIDLDLQDESISAAEKKQLQQQRHSINCYLTPARVSTASRWRRAILSIAMKYFPSMHLPPIAEFVSLQDVQEVILGASAPAQWRVFPGRARRGIESLLRKRGFDIAAGKVGRPSKRLAATSLKS